MTRSRWTAVVAAVAAVVLVGAGAFWLLGGGDDGPRGTAERFTAAWSRGDYAAMGELTAGAPADLTARLAKQRDELGATAQKYTVASVGKPKGGEAGGAYSARLTLAGGRTWSYDGTLGFTKSGGKWKVDWSPTVLYPGLKEGQRLQAARAWPTRGQVSYADGSSMEGSPSGSVQQIVGPLGPATDEVARKLGAPYRKGDSIGVDGLNKQYEKRLAGTPALTVRIVDANGRQVSAVKRFGGADGQPLRTTIDARTQKAAGAALA
ncbi:NTF2-like N-terminal transpeptidase domain-containing protein, partial [Spirillospora sp. NPDC049652]